MAVTDIYTVTGGLTPSRRAMRFIGGNVDDGIQVDSLAAGMVSGNDTKGTITAWIMIPNYTPANALTIFGAGNSAAVEYMHFSVTTARKLQFIAVDTGPSTRVDVSTSNVCITPHKWHHVALVQDGTTPHIYVDGVEQALTYATATEMSQWFDDLDTINKGDIGTAVSIAGAGALTQEFAGYISDFKIWSGTTAAKALSADQILLDFNGGTTTVTPTAWYTMNETVINVANPATYDGTIVGDLIYVDACEFSSKLSFGCGVPLTADNVCVSISGTTGYAIVIQQA